MPGADTGGYGDGCSPTTLRRHGPALALAALLGTSGVLHLRRPGIFRPLIPRTLGDPDPWVLGSGVAELACAAALVVPRRRGGSAGGRRPPCWWACSRGT